jgi:Fe-Mn family superoxide dismutase
MAFELPALPYDYEALQPFMSKETLEYHHDKHHKAYVDKLNELVSGTEWDGKSLEDIVKGTYQKDAVAQNGIFNNASQHWNHAQFWEMMTPKPGAMPSELEKAITESFGSIDDFKKKAAWASSGRAGSGWSSPPAAGWK